MSAELSRTPHSPFSVPEYEVWCPDQDLITQGHRLIVGENAQIAIRPTDRDVLRSLAAIRSGNSRAYWSLAPAGDDSTPAALITGRISRLRSVTTPFMFQTTDWVPVMELSQTRLAGSSRVHPGRSIWAPSGAPVLLGYLVTLTQAAIVGASQAAA